MGANVWTNIFGPVALTRALLPSMRAARRGRIVLVSSQAGARGMPATAAYSAVKGAMERWGESMAGEIAAFGIGVTILVTGTYDTEIITDAGATDVRDLAGPYAAHHNTMDKRGRMAIKLSAKSPQRFADRLSRGSTAAHRSCDEVSARRANGDGHDAIAAIKGSSITRSECCWGFRSLARCRTPLTEDVRIRIKGKLRMPSETRFEHRMLINGNW